MIYLLYGTDKDKAREKARGLVDSLLKKKPDASFFKLTTENWNEASFSEYIGGQGLFENKYIVLADGLFEDKDIKELVVKRVKEIQESQNVFIFREGTLDKATLGKFEKAAEKVQEFEAPEVPKGRKFGMDTVNPLNLAEFNIFSLTDALGKRDKKELWVLYQKTVIKGVPGEEVHGLLFWQIKNMIIASEAKSAKEAGMNPFVFSKAQGFAKKWTLDELKKYSSDLISLSHDARRGIHDFDGALERFVLSI